MRLDDGQVHTFGDTKGRYVDWSGENKRITGLEYDHLDNPVGLSFMEFNPLVSDADFQDELS